MKGPWRLSRRHRWENRSEYRSLWWYPVAVAQNAWNATRWTFLALLFRTRCIRCDPNELMAFSWRRLTWPWVEKRRREEKWGKGW